MTAVRVIQKNESFFSTIKKKERFDQPNGQIYKTNLEIEYKFQRKNADVQTEHFINLLEFKIDR